MAIGKNIRARLEKLKMNMAELARLAHIPHTSVSGIVNESSENPGVYHIVKIANVLHCSVDDLLSGRIDGDYAAGSDAIHQLNLTVLRDIILIVDEVDKEKDLHLTNAERDRHIRDLYALATEDALSRQPETLRKIVRWSLTHK